MRTRLMRICVVVAALVLLAVTPARAQKSQKNGQPVIIEAIVSADGTLSVSGVNFGSQPFLTLDGNTLLINTVMNGPDGDLVTASVPSSLLLGMSH